MGKTVIVVGAGLHGCETAEFLVKRGRKVTIVEPSDRVGEGVLDFRLGLLMEWFGRAGVNIVTGAREMEIADGGLTYTDKDGKRHTLSADTIVPTSPLRANTQLLESLQGMCLSSSDRRREAAGHARPCREGGLPDCPQRLKACSRPADEREDVHHPSVRGKGFSRRCRFLPVWPRTSSHRSLRPPGVGHGPQRRQIVLRYPGRQRGRQ